MFSANFPMRLQLMDVFGEGYNRSVDVKEEQELAIGQGIKRQYVKI